jgi:hypothetical protein
LVILLHITHIGIAVPKIDFKHHVASLGHKQHASEPKKLPQLDWRTTGYHETSAVSEVILDYQYRIWKAVV